MCSLEDWDYRFEIASTRFKASTVDGKVVDKEG